MKSGSSRDKQEEKRMQALLELFKSEKDYAYDLALWSRTYRYLVVNTPNLSMYSKKIFQEHVLINVNSILDMHTEVFEKICSISNTEKSVEKKGFLQSKISADQINGICSAFIEKKDMMLKIYTEYASKLPQATREMEGIISGNESFKQESMNLLQRINRLHLGCLHFIMRPMQKITRYPLLFQAIKKKCREEESSILEKTIEVIREIDKKVNRNVQYSTNYFALYHLMHSMNMRVNTSRVSAGLMQKNRRLIRKEEEVFLFVGTRKKPVTVVILDNCVFLVQDVIQIEKKSTFDIYEKRLFGDYMPLHSISVRKRQSEEANDLFQLQIVCEEQTHILETSEWIIDGMYQDIIEAKREEEKMFTDFKTEQVEIKSPGAEVSLDIISPRKSETLSLDAFGALLIGCSTHLEIVADGERKIVIEMEARNIKYVDSFNAVFFLKKSDLYYLLLEKDGQPNLDCPPKKITSSVFTFFLHKNSFLSEKKEMETILSVKKIGYLGSEELFISKLTLTPQKGILKTLYRRMYMAGDIINLAFFGNHLAIASNDFELINLDDLTTQELLDPLDKTISIYVSKHDSKPIDMIKIDKNLYLVIFEHLGFFINQYGSRKKTNVLFLWLMQVYSVTLYKEYVIALSEKKAKLFTLSDGLLRGVVPIRKGRFLKHPDYLLIYNDLYLHRIFL